MRILYFVPEIHSLYVLKILSEEALILYQEWLKRYEKSIFDFVKDKKIDKVYWDSISKIPLKIEHPVINYLLDKGAKLKETEDPTLIKKFAKEHNSRKLSRILNERDKFIAKNINLTLKKNETGIIFLGSGHNIKPYLDEDIKYIEVEEREKILNFWKKLISL